MLSSADKALIAKWQRLAAYHWEMWRTWRDRDHAAAAGRYYRMARLAMGIEDA